MCTQVMWRLHTTTRYATGPKRLMRKGSTGQGQHGEKTINVAWYIIYQRPLRPLASLKLSTVFLFGEKSPNRDTISLKQNILSQIPFFFKRIKGFFFGGRTFPTFDLENMISTCTKDFSWKKNLNSLDFEEKIISYCQIFMISPVGSR